MARYLIVWAIECEAETPDQAALWARSVQRRQNSATVFEITDRDTEELTVVDLGENE